MIAIRDVTYTTLGQTHRAQVLPFKNLMPTLVLHKQQIINFFLLTVQASSALSHTHTPSLGNRYSDAKKHIQTQHVL